MNKMDNRPIGFFDSGVGGLTVVKEALKQLPHEEIIYIGDTARAPYGPRPGKQIIEFSWELTNFLLKQNIKMLVIACNTATAVALDEIKEKLNIPVIGVIFPGSRAAIRATKNNKIGVIGTVGTINSGSYEKTILSKSPKTQVTSLACPRFVPVVESNQYQKPIAKKVVAETLQELKKENLDTLVLGCTHYPLLRPIIQQVMGEKVKLIDSGAQTISDVSMLLDYFNLSAESTNNPNHRFYTTGSALMFQEILEQWIDSKDPFVKQVKVAKEKINLEQLDDKTIVIATKNKGKAKEFEQMFGKDGYKVKTLLDYPQIPDVEETGTSFEANARLKAETIANLLNTPVLADDSGLVVDALDGMPGIFSARYSDIPGIRKATDASNIAKLLSELHHEFEKGNKPKAHFHSTLVFAAPDKESLVVEGNWHGVIVPIPTGDNGFGYDPIFRPDGLDKTSAQLTSDEKNTLSHRALAVKELEKVWKKWIK
jgi:glutamate racemase/non-canonical purine NTP pyrophosphatase (RdgB/HAM1 family)